MELPVDNKISFIGIEIIKNRTKIDTQVYRKPTNTGLLLHFQSHTDKRYKDCLLKTMIHRAYAQSSTTEAFDQECTRLRSIFTRLDYPFTMINSIITKIIQSLSFGTREKNKEDSSVVRVILPFKDQTSANAVRRQMRDLSHKIGTTLQPVFTSRKLEQDLKPREIKPPIVNQQCVVYSFTCICVIQIMSALQLETSTNVLLNINTLRSLNTSRQPMGIQASSKKANSAF